MPIYEFRCDDCGEKFDQLCRYNWQSAVTCPACNSGKLEKLWSQFASVGQSKGMMAGCDACSRNSCSGCK